MSIVCAYQFEMQPHAGQTSRQCLAIVRDEVAGWVRGSYRLNSRARKQFPFDGSCVAPRAGHEVWTDQQESSPHELATLDWEFPDERHPALVWRFSGVLACDAQSVQVALVIQAVSRAFVLRALRYRLAGVQPIASFGDVVSGLLYDWPCRIEGQPVPTDPLVLDADQVDPFVHETLLSPERVLPVILVASDADEASDGAPAEDAESFLEFFQAQVLGLAQVAALRDQLAVARLAQLLGPERSCEGGAIRIYYPGFTCDAPPENHPFQTADQIRQTGIRTVVRQIYQTLANLGVDQFREGRVIRAARAALARERAGQQRAAAIAATRLAETEAELQQTRRVREQFRQERDKTWGQVRALQGELADVRGQLAALRDACRPEAAGRPEDFDELAAELERAWDENERLRAEGEADRRRVAELETDLRGAKANLAQLWGPPVDAPPTPSPAGERAFGTVADALGAAATEFADVLTVWEDATRSAEHSLFASPAQVFRALQAIAEVGRDYFQAQGGSPPLGPVEKAFRSRVPFKYTGFESQTTLSVYGAERVFHHREQSRQMQRHLTLGGGQTNNCLQIYFEFDDATRRVLIGHCGRHLRFYRQRT